MNKFAHFLDFPAALLLLADNEYASVLHAA